MNNKDSLLCNKDVNIEKIYNLLNYKVYELYETKLFNPEDVAKIKQLLLTGLNYIERTIKGTFSCDIFMKNADINTLKKMFPLACSNKMFNLTNEEDVKKLGSTLENIRDINAHYIVFPIKTMFLKKNYDFLKNFKPLNKNIVYLNNNKITLAGLIFIVICFLRAESIKELCKINKIIGLISCGYYTVDDGNLFVQETSNTNLEIDIRQKTGEDLTTSIVGEYDKLIQQDNGLNVIKIGTVSTPTYKISFKINNNEVFIKEGSLTKIYYEDDYKLKIENINDFISFSNKLPPFVFLDYLYGKKITTFDKKAIEIVNNDFELISKLNHPKFYINKNLNILLLGNKWADFRLMSSLFNSHISNVFLSLTTKVYEYANINKSLSFVQLLHLPLLNLDNNIITKSTILRNFVAHGYIVHEYAFFNGEMVKYTFEDAIITLKELCDSLIKHPDLQCYLEDSINEYIVNRSIQSKYKKIRYASIEYINNPSSENLENLKRTNGWINNSGFDINLFLLFNNYLCNKFSFIKIESSLLEYPLYLSDSTNDLDLFKEYMNKHQYIITSKEKNGLLTKIKIEKGK